MKFTILGSGTSTGVPMVGCNCPVCSSADPRDMRTRSSLLVRHNNRNILIDTSPDLRRQALRERLTHIDAVLFTHSHADHVNGIDDLRGFHFLNRQVIPCYASQSTFDILLNGFSYIFIESAGSGYTPLMTAHVIGGPFDLFGLHVIPIPLEHGQTPALGYKFGGCAYLTDCSGIPKGSRHLLSNLDILIIDGLRWRSHPSHFNIETAIEAAAGLAPRRIILTHLSHDVLYAERVRLPSGVEFAYDGMELDLTEPAKENRDSEE